MAKAKITIEVELDDLSCYYPDDPKGITLENLGHFFHNRLVCATREEKLDNIFEEPTVLKQEGRRMVKAIALHTNQDIILAERVLDSMKIEIV